MHLFSENNFTVNIFFVFDLVGLVYQSRIFSLVANSDMVQMDQIVAETYKSLMRNSIFTAQNDPNTPTPITLRKQKNKNKILYEKTGFHHSGPVWSGHSIH